MAVPDQRLVEAPIFEQSVEGLRAVLGRVAVDFGQPPIPAVMVPGGGFTQREISQQLGGAAPQYPYIGIWLQSVSRVTVGYNNNLRRQGVTVVSGDKLLTYKLNPVLATFGVVFYSQDNAELIKFTSRWLTRQNDAQFVIANDKFNINIQVRMNEQITIPPLEVTEAGNVFQLQTECEIYTYIGEIVSTTRINSINLTTNLWNSATKNVVASSTRVYQLPTINSDPGFN